MKKINHSQLGSLINFLYNGASENERKIPLMVMGTFGIGKSHVVLDQAKKIAESKNKTFIAWNYCSNEERENVVLHPERYFVFLDIRLSEYDASDIKGLPDFTADRNRVVWKSPQWSGLMTAKNSDGILFFDEMNLAPPLVISSTYKILYDRIIGNESIEKEWLIIAAGNKESDGGFSFSIPPAVQDRACEVELLPPQHESWINWAINNQIESRIIAYLQWKGHSQLHNVDLESDCKHTTPRGWARLSQLLKSNDIAESTDFDLLVNSSIGEKTGLEFIAFCNLNKKIALEDLIQNPQLIEKFKGDPGVLYFIASAIPTAFESVKKLSNAKFIEICERIFEIGNPEIVTIIWRMLIKGPNKKTRTRCEEILSDNQNKSKMIQQISYGLGES